MKKDIYYMLFFLISLIPQHYCKLNFLSTWATKSCPGFCHVEEFTYLSVAKINKQNSDMTWQKYKLNLRNSLLSEEYFRVMEQFDSTLPSVIDSTLGLRCRSFGYRYSEIIRSLMSIYFCGGSCTPGCHYSFDEPSLTSSDTSHL